MSSSTKKNEKSLHDLALKYQQTKCEKVFNEIYKILQYPLFEHIFNILKNVDKAKAVRSKTFEKMFLHIDKFNPIYKFTTWIYNIATNEAYFYYNNEKKNKSLFLNDIVSNESSNESIEFDFVVDKNELDNSLIENEYETLQKEEDEKALLAAKITLAMECINCLPPKYALILKEKYVNELKQKEISEKHNMNFNTVKTRIFYATQNVKMLYNDKINKILIDLENGKI